MLRVKAQRVLNARVEKVFSYLSDLESRLEEQGFGDTSVEKSSEGPVGVGSTFQVRETRTSMYGTHTTTVVEEVREFVPNKRLVYERLVGEPPATRAVRTSIEVEAVAGGTQITKSYEHLLPSLRARPLVLVPIVLLMPIVRLVEYWDLTRELRRIRSVVEAEEAGHS